MSTGRAKKSTGPRSALNAIRNQTTRRTSQRNSALNLEFSSDSDDPTQRLRQRNRNSTTNNLSLPSTSGISSNSQVIASDSDSDEDVTQRMSHRRRNQREQSSSDTTSDSDVPVHDRSIRQNNNSRTKKPPAKIPNSTAKQKKPRNQRRDSSDSDAEYDETQNKSLSTSQSAAKSRSISGLVNKCVYYLLVVDQKKYALKRQEIIKHVFCNQDHKLYNQVIEGANNVLKQVYGLEIIKSENRKGEYLLINCLDRDLSVQQFMELSNEELQKRGLIFYLLAVIFMNENSINEDDLGMALKALGIDINARNPHPIFGDVKKYLTVELVKQMYLEYRCISKDPPLYEFSWGIRAKQEVDKKDLLDFACKIMGDTKPEEWILQYKDAMETAKEREDKQNGRT